MGTFSFKKSIADVEDPVLLPEDWYDFEIYKEPEIRPNYSLSQEINEDTPLEEIEKLMAGNEKLGYNLVVYLESESPDDVYNGRKMKANLPWPSDADEELYDAIGQKVYDAKMQRIEKFADAFVGSFEDKELTLMVGAKGAAYVTVTPGGTIPGREEDSNNIDVYRAGFKEYGER